MSNDKVQDELRKLLQQNFAVASETKNNSDFCVSEATAKAFEAAESQEDTCSAPWCNVDFEKEESRFKAKGELFIKSMYSFYLDYGLITKPEYLENKAKLDSLNIANIFDQIATTKTIMRGLLGELTRGNMNTRLVESYCTLNSQMSDMIKAQANYVLFLEESYKKSRIEAIEYNNLAAEQISISQGSTESGKIKSLSDGNKKQIDGDYYITSDTKSLMDEIQSDKEMYYDDAKNNRSEYLIDDTSAAKLTNPSGKDVLIEKYNVDKTLIDDNVSDSSFGNSVEFMI